MHHRSSNAIAAVLLWSSSFAFRPSSTTSFSSSSSSSPPPSSICSSNPERRHHHLQQRISHSNKRMSLTSSSSACTDHSPVSESSTSSITSCSTTRTSLLVLIRHGRSVENEKMQQPGSGWGDATFCDDWESRDSPLSSHGIEQAQALCDELHRTFGSSSSTKDDDDNDGDEYDIHINSSPLTRSLQTFQLGVLPWFQSQTIKHQDDDDNNHDDDNVDPSTIHATSPTFAKALPLCTERIYTAADIGRPASQLKLEFPMVDFTACPDDDQEPWWWELPTNHQHQKVEAENNDSDYEEWRPHGQGQWYAVPGEPWNAFDQRMKRLQAWIEQQFEAHEQQRSTKRQGDGVTRMVNGESNSIPNKLYHHRRPKLLLIMVTHWGVIRYLTGGEEVKNCEILTMTPEKFVKRQAQNVEPGL